MENIFIIGDLIIDQIWLVGKPTEHVRGIPTFFHVFPRNLINPNFHIEVAGGVGTIARVLWNEHIASNVLTGWSSDHSPTNLGMIPEWTGAGSQLISWSKVANYEYNAISCRIYEPKENSSAELIHKFDREIVNLYDSQLTDIVTWPGTDNRSIVIAGDYTTSGETSLLAKPLAIKWIRDQREKKNTILLRSQNKRIIRDIPWDLLSINIHQLRRELSIRPFYGSLAKKIDDNISYHPLLVKAIKTMRDTWLTDEKSSSFVLLNLEKEGALLISEDTIFPIMLEGIDSDMRPLWATDVLFGQTAMGIAEDNPFREKTRKNNIRKLVDDCYLALKITNQYIAKSKKIRQNNWYGPRLIPKNEVRADIPEDLANRGALIDTISANYEKAYDFEKLLNSGIALHRASWYLNEFITTSEEYGNNINMLREHIEEYLNSQPKRPFVTALCGGPGSGKSTLAEKMAKAMNCESISENASQWSSIDDLFFLLERVRSIHMRGNACFVFIDEVDTPVGGEMLYGKLLAPLWDGAYIVKGDIRTIGTPTIFLLAGSTSSWRSDNELLKDTINPITRLINWTHKCFKKRLVRIEDDLKLSDLTSRFTVRPITIPQPTQVDLAYLAAWHFKKNNPYIENIQEGVIRLIACSGRLKHGRRSVSRIVELFKSLSNNSVVQTNDISEEDETQFSLHLEGVPSRWRDQRRLISISQ